MLQTYNVLKNNKSLQSIKIEVDSLKITLIIAKLNSKNIVIVIFASAKQNNFVYQFTRNKC